MGRAPVFQMSLGMDSESRIGWLLSDETAQPDDAYSFAFTVPWHPNISFDQFDFVLFGDRQGELLEFPLKFDGHLFINEQTKTRFSLSDPLAPNDFRGLPFLRPFPYIGAFRETLESYDLTGDFLSFLPLTPLDLLRMDDLFLKQHIAFVGVTHSFGPHTRSGFRWSQPAAADLGEAIEASKQEFKDAGSIERGYDPPDVTEINDNLYCSVEELALSVRSYNYLKNAQIQTIANLVTRSEADMLKNFDRKSLNEIKEILAQMGLCLGMKIDEQGRLIPPPGGMPGGQGKEPGEQPPAE